MSRENVELVKAFYERVAEGDFGVLDEAEGRFTDPDFRHQP